MLCRHVGGKVAHGPWKKPLDFGSNPNHVTLCGGTTEMPTWDNENKGDRPSKTGGKGRNLGKPKSM